MPDSTFIYGTAWKKERTTDLVTNAIEVGFRAIDTANQLKHYNEIGVGEALNSFFKKGMKREEFFLQSKFTSPDGQDHRLPYDLKADIKTQVLQSFESSLKHLHTDYLDSYLLHGPYNFPGLGDEDWQVWSALENLYEEGRAKQIGISNVNSMQLEELLKKAKIKPMTVQNRCYASRGWDFEVRKICLENKINYQGFSLLTANPEVLSHPEVSAIAEKYSLNTEQVVFRFSMDIGMIPLTGTSNKENMKLDLSVKSLKLQKEEVVLIERIFISL